MISKTKWVGAACALVMACAMLSGCGDGASSDSPERSDPAVKEPVKPLLQKKEIADWCPEHGVPESICTRCNDTLAAGFKEKGDWCAKHDAPESQCFDCDPSLEAKFKANAPAGVQDE